MQRVMPMGLSLPRSVEATQRYYVQGSPSTLGGVTEWLTMRRVVLLAAAVLLYRRMNRRPVVRNQKPETCDEKYCPPSAYETHVDRPMNTLLKDQSLGAGLSLPVPASLRVPYRKTKSDYYVEAMRSPGVRLVAHAVA